MNPNSPYAASGVHRFRAQIALVKIACELPIPNVAFDACVFAGIKAKERDYILERAAEGCLPSQLAPQAWLVEHWQAEALRTAIRWIDNQRGPQYSEATNVRLLEARNALSGALAIYLRGPIHQALRFVITPSRAMFDHPINWRRDAHPKRERATGKALNIVFLSGLSNPLHLNIDTRRFTVLGRGKQ